MNRQTQIRTTLIQVSMQTVDEQTQIWAMLIQMSMQTVDEHTLNRFTHGHLMSHIKSLNNKQTLRHPCNERS